MRPIFKSPHKIASSAAVECGFNELKNQILRFHVKPMTVDRFVVTHLKSIESDAKLFKSTYQKTLVHQNHETIKPSINSSSDSSEEKEDTDNFSDSYENWGGKGDEELIPQQQKVIYKKPRSSKYMDSVPEIDRILLNRTTRSSKNNLLLNGNIATPLTVSKKRFLVQNTCPFDSITVLISTAYNENEKYKIYLNNSQNNLLQFCKSLALEPVSKDTYKRRLSLLQTIFPEDTGVTDVKLIDARCNVNFMATSFLKNAPSAVESLKCSNETCVASKNISSPTIILRLKNLDFSMLAESLHDYIKTKTSNCVKVTCDGILKTSRTLQDHIFIESDIYAENLDFKLMDFPIRLSINNERLSTKKYLFYNKK